MWFLPFAPYLVFSARNNYAASKPCSGNHESSAALSKFLRVAAEREEFLLAQDRQKAARDRAERDAADSLERRKAAEAGLMAELSAHIDDRIDDGA